MFLHVTYCLSILFSACTIFGLKRQAQKEQLDGGINLPQ
jgi:hypothetical protein